jgi:outer membrane murein-binding lipoprotein Lpp
MTRAAPLPAAALAVTAAVAAALALAACSSRPPTPDWQMNAQSSMQRFTTAYLTGDTRVETLEFTRARAEIARTGRPDLLARAELLRCATRVASLVVEPCAGFEALREDAAPPERAYANFLAGKATPQEAALLPEAQRGTVAAGANGDVALKEIKDPLSQLVAAGVLFQTGRATPTTIALATDTASAQGWRRPLLAWLLVQAQRADQAGAGDEAARIRRRIAVVEQGGVKP